MSNTTFTMSKISDRLARRMKNKAAKNGTKIRKREE